MTDFKTPYKDREDDYWAEVDVERATIAAALDRLSLLVWLPEQAEAKRDHAMGVIDSVMDCG